MNAFEFNTTTGEPFLRLLAPHSNIIITPPRMSDVEPSVAILNGPAVAPWMGSRMPTGYPAEKAQTWLAKIKEETDEVVGELQSTPDGPFSGCPVRHIREVQEDGSEVFIGDVVLGRSGFTHVLDAEERSRLVAENNARAVGDPDVVWNVGCKL
jgi:hypothetical protein